MRFGESHFISSPFSISIFLSVNIKRWDKYLYHIVKKSNAEKLMKTPFRLVMLAYSCCISSYAVSVVEEQVCAAGLSKLTIGWSTIWAKITKRLSSGYVLCNIHLLHLNWNWNLLITQYFFFLVKVNELRSDSIIDWWSYYAIFVIVLVESICYCHISRSQNQLSMKKLIDCYISDASW